MYPAHVVPTVTASVALTTGTTSFPNVAPHNTFSLTCTATAPGSVVDPKTFRWMRATTAEGSCSQVVDSTDQAMSTSVLTVTETTPGNYRYCCRADLTTLGVTGTQSNLLSITVTGKWCSPLYYIVLFFGYLQCIFMWVLLFKKLVVTVVIGICCRVVARQLIVMYSQPMFVDIYIYIYICVSHALDPFYLDTGIQNGVTHCLHECRF